MVGPRPTSHWLLSLLSAVTLTGSLVSALDSFVPGAFIVEYEDGADIDAELSSVGDQVETRMKLDFELFKGASIRFTDLDNAQTLAADLLADSNNAVKSIWPVTRYSVPAHTVHWTADEDATLEDQEEAAARARQATADLFSPHVMTQVNKLRDEGVDGTGIKVAVIDTGIDYKHPALGGCFGEGCLVSFGYDFVGDEYNGLNTPVPDPDPMDCDGHGTHVAGIIAAQTNNPYGIIGAATGVEMGMYRVFGCDGTSADDVLIAAYNMAYESGADLITASIGGASGWSQQPWAVAVSRIVAKGVPCLVSAGNNGAQGLFYTSSAASGQQVTSVGSVENVLAPNLFTNASYVVEDSATSSVEFGFAPGKPAAWGGVTLPLYATTFNTSDPVDACAPLPEDTPDLSGYVVLVRRGTCSFVAKLQNVAAAGGRYVVFYNNVPNSLPSVAGTAASGIEAVAMVKPELGAVWASALAAGLNVTVAMTDPAAAPKYLVTPPNNTTAGAMSAFSTWGPNFGLELKPQFASPGAYILSTFPTADGSYAVLSGTSMACPLMAGIYALVMSVRGTRDPLTLESLLSASANPNVFNDGKAFFPYLAPVAQQGGGMVQAYDAAYATTLLSVSSIAFNDTDNMVAEKTFAISNTANTSVTYTIRDVRAATAYTMDAGSIFPAAFPNELTTDADAAASLAFDVESPFTLAAGERKIITVNCTPPAGLDASRLPVYSGWIVLNGSDSSSGLSLPYQGVVGSMNSATVLDANGTFLSGTLDNATATNSTRTGGRRFLLPPPGRSNDTEFAANATDYPLVTVSLAMGSPIVRIDVVPLDVPAGTNTSESVGLKTIGDLFMTPLRWVERNPEGAGEATRWNGQLLTGEYAPAGTYRIVVRALKIFGDAADAADYETVEMPSFSIDYMPGNGTTTAGSRRRRAGGL